MSLSHVLLFAIPWTIQSMESSTPEYWSEQPFPSPGDLPNPGIKPRSLALQADSSPAELPGKPKNTGVDSLSLSPGDLPDPGIELEILYQLSYQGSQRDSFIFFYQNMFWCLLSPYSQYTMSALSIYSFNSFISDNLELTFECSFCFITLLLFHIQRFLLSLSGIIFPQSSMFIIFSCILFNLFIYQ